VLSRGQGGFAAIVVTLAAVTLMILDLTDGALRRWWSGHALTTDMVSGLLVLLITVLVIDQVVRLRQINDRAQAVAAQAAIVVNQAIRTSQAVSAAVGGPGVPGDRDAASDEFRTYMLMLLVGAPVLIDAKVSRTFLEQAQQLGGEMARALGTFGAFGSTATATATAPDPGVSTDRLDHAVQQLKTASAPLLAVLDPQTRIAVGAEDISAYDGNS
jgi:hypothetical protein